VFSEPKSCLPSSSLSALEASCIRACSAARCPGDGPSSQSEVSRTSAIHAQIYTHASCTHICRLTHLFSAVCAAEKRPANANTMPAKTLPCACWPPLSATKPTLSTSRFVSSTNAPSQDPSLPLLRGIVGRTRRRGRLENSFENSTKISNTNNYKLTLG
jgi:hypothetical protein